MTTDSNQSGASSAGADGQSNTKSTSNPSCGSPAGTEGQPSTKSTEAKELERRVIFWLLIITPVVLIAAIVLLVGLPLGTVWIMNSADCCLTDNHESAVSFWASMIGGFLALFGMIITAAFIITAFRVDATAQAKAQVVAQKAVWNYLKNEQAELVKDLKCVKALVEEVKKCGKNALEAMVTAQDATTDAAREAQEAIARALENVEAQQEEASGTIVAARDATTNAASQAQEGIATALEETGSAATEAQEAMGRAAQEVDRQHDDAIRAIGDARQRAEVAAREVQERADRGIEGSPPTEGDDPDRDD